MYVKSRPEMMMTGWMNSSSPCNLAQARCVYFWHEISTFCFILYSFPIHLKNYVGINFSASKTWEDFRVNTVLEITLGETLFKKQWKKCNPSTWEGS
jgi:hypothetical protein